MRAMDKVIGYASIKEELYRICDILKDYEKYKTFGIEFPKGILFYGEPGIGKSLLSECFIEDTGLNNFTIRKTKSDGDFINYIKNTFDEAKKSAPSIIYIDDMDKFENEDETRVNGESYITIQACIDDVKNDKVFVIATANNLRLLPNSLRRAGRFDKTIRMNCPKGEDATKIVEYYLKDKQCANDINAEKIARILSERSCAVLKQVVNDAAIRAVYANKKRIDMDDILFSCLRIIYHAPECIESDKYKFIRNIAYHEAGHAVIQEILVPGSVNLVSVIKNESRIEGVTSISGSEYDTQTFEDLEKRIIALLGGKAAIELKFGIADIGCENDLDTATRILRDLVGECGVLGFSSRIWGNIASEYAKGNLDSNVSKKMEEYYNIAKRILIENNDLLEEMTNRLVDKKIITFKDIEEIKANI